jgi:hypothetical protein
MVVQTYLVKSRLFNICVLNGTPAMMCLLNLHHRFAEQINPAVIDPFTLA